MRTTKGTARSSVTMGCYADPIRAGKVLGCGGACSKTCHVEEIVKRGGGLCSHIKRARVGERPGSPGLHCDYLTGRLSDIERTPQRERHAPRRPPPRLIVFGHCVIFHKRLTAERCTSMSTQSTAQSMGEGTGRRDSSRAHRKCWGDGSAVKGRGQDGGKMKTRCNCAWFCMREELPLGQPAPSHTMPTALLGGLQGIAAWRAQKPISSIHAHLSGFYGGAD